MESFAACGYTENAEKTEATENRLESNRFMKRGGFGIEYRTLGKDLTVSAVGLGCMGMSHAYGAPADKNKMRELIAQAVDLGYTFFDTAEVYGTPENPHDNEAGTPAGDKIFRFSERTVKKV